MSPTKRAGLFVGDAVMVETDHGRHVAEVIEYYGERIKVRTTRNRTFVVPRDKLTKLIEVKG
jgi:hypothetical protein